MAANKKKKKNVEIKNKFFYSKNQTKEAVKRNIELNIYTDPLLPEWQLRHSFQQMNFDSLRI